MGRGQGRSAEEKSTEPNLRVWGHYPELAAEALMNSHAITAAPSRAPGESPDDGLDAEMVRLVELRNPWGNDKEWNGDWSDNVRREKKRRKTNANTHTRTRARRACIYASKIWGAFNLGPQTTQCTE